MRVTSGPNVKVNQPESPFAAYEKKLGLKIKEDVLPLFGNEIALSVPVKALGVGGHSLRRLPRANQEVREKPRSQIRFRLGLSQ